MIHLTMSIVLLTDQRPAAMGPWVPILIAMVISFSLTAIAQDPWNFCMKHSMEAVAYMTSSILAISSSEYSASHIFIIFWALGQSLACSSMSMAHWCTASSDTAADTLPGSCAMSASATSLTQSMLSSIQPISWNMQRGISWASTNHPSISSTDGHSMPGLLGLPGLPGLPGLLGFPGLPGLPGLPGFPLLGFFFLISVDSPFMQVSAAWLILSAMAVPAVQRKVVSMESRQRPG